jgi:NADPH-dependent 2,4-dienoyl-CoA reductase/sulfur reductase-like enzyme
MGMEERNYKYIIVGGGLAAASAVAGIREIDPKGSILLVGSEKHLPYDRPPLSKSLWFGKKKLGEIFIHPQDFYDENGVTLMLGAAVSAVDPNLKKIVIEKGRSLGYEKLLLATGARPKILAISGAALEGTCYYRTLDDYLKMKGQASPGKSALVIGGGFIGAELAAALTINKVKVTMLFPGPTLCHRIFPEGLGRAIRQRYLEKGVQITSEEKPAAITKRGDQFITITESGKRIQSDIVVMGIGVLPDTRLARPSGIETGNGIVVNAYLQTSQPDIYAAGDNAQFPYQALGREMRVEHWDNALNQGKWAGRNMAGSHEPYTYMPYFFSDLFEFGYEAVGEIDGSLETYADWQKENDTGVVYYLRSGRVRGAMLCNVWNQVALARKMILRDEPVARSSLQGAII